MSQVPIDPITLKFSGANQKALAEALAAAYPDPAQLDQMLVARLDQPLAGITAPYPLTQATWNVVAFYKAKGHLLRLVASARASQPDHPLLTQVAERFGLAVTSVPTPQLEKIVKSTSVPFPVTIWRERLARREVCVCRIELPTNNGMSFGTGFLVGPDLVLTNHHVMAPAIAGREGAHTPGGLTVDPTKVSFRFDYKELSDKTPVNEGIEVRLAADWLVDASPHSPADLQAMPKAATPTMDELDFALVRLADAIGDAAIALGNDTDPQARTRGWVELPAAQWPFTEQSSLFILQHPKGAPMNLALDLEAKMTLNANATRVMYQTGTEPGSSGSPCFNQFWDVIALHHAGDPSYPDLFPGSFNEGIPISRIVERLQAKGLTAGLTIT